jgi:hypothetical protein
MLNAASLPAEGSRSAAIPLRSDISIGRELNVDEHLFCVAAGLRGPSRRHFARDIPKRPFAINNSSALTHEQMT